MPHLHLSTIMHIWMLIVRRLLILFRWNISIRFTILYTVIKLLVFHCFSASQLRTSLLHFILFFALIWLIAMCIYRHSSWEARLVSVLIMYNGRFSPWPYVLLSIGILFLKIVRFINFLNDFLVFILNFFYLFFKILKLLM